MNKNVIFGILIGLFIISAVGIITNMILRNAIENKNDVVVSSEAARLAQEEANKPLMEVTVKRNGTKHDVNGSITAASTCDIVTPSISTSLDLTQVTINVSHQKPKNPENCEDTPTKKDFKISFEAAENATIDGYINFNKAKVLLTD